MKSTSTGNIGIIPLFSIIILTAGLTNHVFVIPPLLQVAQRDAWLSVILSIIPYMIWISMLYYIMKRTDRQPIIAWLTQHFGKIIAGGVRMIFIIYLLFICMVTLKDTTVWTHVSYLSRTPRFILAFTLVLLCYMAVQYGIRAIAISAGILLPLVILFGDFVLSANIPAKDYTLLMPLFENGWMPSLRGMVFVCSGLIEVALLLLLQHHLKAKVPVWFLYGTAMFLIILALGPVTGAIAEFGPFEAARLRYTAFEEWRLVRVGKFIQHLDFLSIYQWLSGAFIKLSLGMYFLVHLLSSGTRKQVNTRWLIIISIFLLVTVELPFSDMQYSSFLQYIFFPVSLVVIGLLSIFLFVLMWFIPRKKGGA